MYVPGYDTIWIVGDDFTNRTVGTFTNDTTNKYYMKDRFEVKTYSNPRISGTGINTLGRLRNCLLPAIHKELKFLKIIVMVLDDDLIHDTKRESMGLVKIYGRTLEWLMSKLHKTITVYKEYLPNKARRYKYPHLLCICPPLHRYFYNNSQRLRFAESLEIVTSQYIEMSALSLKKIWDEEDTHLVIKDKQRLSARGEISYWQAVDATVKYWDNKFSRDLHQQSSGYNPGCSTMTVHNKFNWHKKQPL